MKKLLSILTLALAATTVFAVPARRGWQTRIQPDGSSVEVQLFGDESYHYMVNRSGQQIVEKDGFYVPVGPAPTRAQACARHEEARAARKPQVVGLKPNLAPKGVVILANFKDQAMEPAHDLAVFQELCNAGHCTVNTYEGVSYPSAAQYFADQSNGAYRPQFDVFGPVTLSRDMAYYGTDVGREGNDQHAADAVAEACILANTQYTINWADYDSDNDGEVDFVYLIFAGKGQADGGAATTIWPTAWTLNAAYIYGSCTYTAAERILGGKRINNYACSGELASDGFSGIGTLCHEFGHVMGLADLYDTSYGVNYDKFLTPNNWDIMDIGCYCGGGHCPPNYSIWEKAFMGWETPVNPGYEGRILTLQPNGAEGYAGYQINASGVQQPVTTEGLNYYIENRQQTGWDTFVPAHGLLLWRVDFHSSAWVGNKPNHSSTTDSPHMTIISANPDSIIGYGPASAANTFPGSSSVTSWTGIPGKPLLNIRENDGVVSLTYIYNPNDYVVSWVVNGQTIEKSFYALDGSEALRLPEVPVTPCDGKTFIGWTTRSDWTDPFRTPEDLFVTLSDLRSLTNTSDSSDSSDTSNTSDTSDSSVLVTRSVTYYAVFE